jgi:hypothetical protein
MPASAPELSDLMRRCQTVVAAMVRQAHSSAERAGSLADLLHQLLPQAQVTACLLVGEGDGCLAVRPETGSIGPEQLNPVLEQIRPSASQETGVHMLPDAPMPGMRLFWVPFYEGERLRGVFLVGLSAGEDAQEVSRVENLLAIVGPLIGMCIELERARTERAELARFALLGQAFAGLAHDLNNALNSMMLQTSVVQLRVDAQARQDLAAIRQHGVQAAALVRSLQQVVQERREQSYAVDFNAAVTEVLEEEAELARRILVALSREGPQIQATRSAVKLFVRLLLEGVCAGTKLPVQMATEKTEGGAGLALTITQPGQASEPPSAEEIVWTNLDDLGRQAGQSLLRQLGGTLAVERNSAGEVVLRITWA